jgi:hypothetical protein
MHCGGIQDWGEFHRLLQARFGMTRKPHRADGPRKPCFLDFRANSAVRHFLPHHSGMPRSNR